jgi:alpha-tubulin suppressor-like RCC1 family protein
MAIKTNGTLWSWGYNIHGALGHNNVISRSSPVQIGATNNWNLISVGQYQAAAIKTDGTLWTWGLNGNGELSQPGTYISSPTQVGTNTNWSKIVMSSAVLAIKTDGTLWSWGTNGFRGRLGQNFSTNSGTGGTLGSPTQIGTGTTWNNINVSEAMMATKTDGTLWVWGSNDVGQLGIGSTQSYGRSSPVQLGSNTNWSILTRGGITGAIKTDGTLWLWGRNGYGKLGLNLRESNEPVATSPRQVGTDTTWNDVTCGTDTVLATKTNGTLWSWGQIQSGSLGQNDNYDGNFVHRSSPTQVGALTTWNQIGIAAGTGMATQSNQ